MTKCDLRHHQVRVALHKERAKVLRLSGLRIFRTRKRGADGRMSIDTAVNGLILHTGTVIAETVTPLSVESIEIGLRRVEEHEARNKLGPVIDRFRRFDELDDFDCVVPLMMTNLELVRYVNAEHFR
jgi:hypothetical protein